MGCGIARFGRRGLQGMIGRADLDEFLGKFQTGFDPPLPPALVQETMLRFLQRHFLDMSDMKFSENSSKSARPTIPKPPKILLKKFVPRDLEWRGPCANIRDTTALLFEVPCGAVISGPWGQNLESTFSSLGGL